MEWQGNKQAADAARTFAVGQTGTHSKRLNSLSAWRKDLKHGLGRHAGWLGGREPSGLRAAPRTGQRESQDGDNGRMLRA